MIISWFGQSSFKIEGEKVTLVTDPFDEACGLKVPRLAADIVTISHDHHDHNNVGAVKGMGEDKPFVITEPGEYEVKNAFIYGLPTYHDNENGKSRGANIVYRIEIDGISLAHLGDLGHVLEDGDIEKLEGIDVLMIPVGGADTIDAKVASQIISQVEPRVVIPMHYKIKGLKTKTELDSLDKFCKEIGVCPAEELSKFKLTKKDLPQDNMKVVVLQP